MSRPMLQRRLVDLSERMKRLREELAVTEEQLLFVEGEADDARLRALVAEIPLADREQRETRRHADALAKHRDTLRRSIEDLRREQDELLDKMSANP